MTESKRIEPPVKVLEWLGDEQTGFLRLLDQTRLPEHLEFIDCHDAKTLWDAIRRLVVRGAPAIGVAAGYGMVLSAQGIGEDKDFLAGLEKAAQYLESSRPTAVNLAWAVRRVLQCVRTEAGGMVTRCLRDHVEPGAEHGHAKGSVTMPLLRKRILQEAISIEAEDQAMCLAIGRNAAHLVRQCRGVLTHCNAGALASAGIGTATAPMYVAHADGHAFTVYCDETRPLLQGSRLTAWELGRAGIDTVLIADSMAAQVMREGRVQMVIVGADRIAANGDTANKIGTYGVAILAARHRIPFYVAAPYSTFDLSIRGGEDIPIEQRGSEEITHGFGRRTAPHGVKTYSPAFDVTPVELISGIITDRGIIQPLTVENIAKVVKG